MEKKIFVIFVIISCFFQLSTALASIGDVDGGGAIKLNDAITAMKICTGKQIADKDINKNADVNMDGKIGLEEGVYVLNIIKCSYLDDVNITIDMNTATDSTIVAAFGQDTVYSYTQPSNGISKYVIINNKSLAFQYTPNNNFHGSDSFTFTVDGCTRNFTVKVNDPANEVNRKDSAVKLEINLLGSLQNPAFSPDGKTIVFTRFRNGYNKPPSDLYTFNLETKVLKPLVVDGNSNVNLPGECWNSSINSIVFSSEREPHDEIYYISGKGTTGDEIRITSRPDKVAFEPTFSPDGRWVVFETHKVDDENNGVITKYKLDGTSGYINLTPITGNCKQPNWSASGDKILYQKEENGQWDIWVMNTDGTDKTKVTNFEGSKTDAVFSADGQYIIFSAENNQTDLANIYKAAISNGNPIRLTNYSGYDGAPSISPDGTEIVFESSSVDPDKSNGTSLWIQNLSDKNYKQEMRNFVQDISAYAKGINPNFAIIPQNGAELVSTTGEKTGSPDINYINAIDGIGQEDLFYGYNANDQATPSADNEWMCNFLDMAKNNGTVKIMVTDYCSTPSKINDSYSQNNSNGYISFAADHRALDNIPAYPIYNENADKITNLQDAKNFLYLINPDNEYFTKQEFVDAVKNTNYDYIIMDFFYNGEEFTPTQIKELKQKANGGKRLLICYMSIGEAENYRYYWQADWTIGNPSFIEKEDQYWPGNYYVRYWDTKWQNIIFGNDSSYLKKIIDAGFDGVYLDIIDAFEQFEK